MESGDRLPNSTRATGITPTRKTKLLCTYQPLRSTLLHAAAPPEGHERGAGARRSTLKEL
jgi:hypothetical protein